MSKPIAPSPNDFSLCLRCSFPSVFTKEMTLRKPTEEEWKLIKESPECAVLRRAIRDIDRSKI